jgi:hypothetical protein
MADMQPPPQEQNEASNPLTNFELDISKWIVIFLGGLLLVLVLAQIGVAAKWLDPAPITSLFDMYKGIALPILTLVLGHYFGSRDNG